MLMRLKLINNILFSFGRSFPVQQKTLLTKVHYPLTSISSLTQQLIQLSKKPNQSQEDFTHLAKNYLQLTEQSFYYYVQKESVDPHLLLMFVASFQQPSQIKKILPLLYHHIDYYEKKQMLLLLELILTFKPLKKPRVPFAKPLQQIESCLVILSSLYPCDSLISWLEYIPLYEGEQVYILSMGFFSILEKMSKQKKLKYENLIKKCEKRIYELIKDLELDMRVGVAILALQLSYFQALPFFFNLKIDLDQVEPHKLCILLINLHKYMIMNEELIDQSKKIARKTEDKLVSIINTYDLSSLLKVQLFVDFWRILHSQQLTGPWKTFVDQLSRLATTQKYEKSLLHLSSEQLLVVLQCMEKHKLNKEKLLKMILVFFSRKLEKMEKSELIRLSKALVTYVRQCQKYLFSVRKIIQKRKKQFSSAQINELNKIFDRVKVLFPRPF